jgi:hypothetical protein
MKQFSKVLQSIKRLPPEFHHHLEGHAQCLSLKRHDLIKSCGHEYDKLIFIEEGVVRNCAQNKTNTCAQLYILLRAK